MTLKKADKLNLIKTDFTTAVCFKWRFSDNPKTPLFNLIFCLYLCWLGNEIAT